MDILFFLLNALLIGVFLLLAVMLYRYFSGKSVSRWTRGGRPRAGALHAQGRIFILPVGAEICSPGKGNALQGRLCETGKWSECSPHRPFGEKCARASSPPCGYGGWKLSFSVARHVSRCAVFFGKLPRSAFQ